MQNHNTNQPLVSVIMPVYNAAPYLRQAIQSILDQTYQNWELIIIDDASTDGSWKIIEQYKLKARGKLFAYRLDENVNAGGDTAANIAYYYASGEYIARMDADDIAHPKRLEQQVAFLQKNPQITVVGSNAVVIDKNGKKMGKKLMPATHEAIRREYFCFHPMINPTVMINRVLIPLLPQLYELKNSSNNDYYTFFKLLCHGHRFANIQQPLLKYRIHGHNDSLANVKRSFRNTLKTRLEMVREYHYRPTLLGWLTTAAQAAIILVLPERVLFELYLYLRNIKRPSLTISAQSAWKRVKQSLVSLLPQQQPSTLVTASEH